MDALDLQLANTAITLGAGAMMLSFGLRKRRLEWRPRRPRPPRRRRYRRPIR